MRNKSIHCISMIIMKTFSYCLIFGISLFLGNSMLYGFSYDRNVGKGKSRFLTEFLQNPIGIDNSSPRFSWTFEEKYKEQQAYQILISETQDFAVPIWNSQKIESNNNVVIYSGPKLQSFTQYHWKVTIWDKNGKVLTSPPTTFETGMMTPDEWKGVWISDHNDIHDKKAPYFRKKFELQHKNVKHARAYIAAGGLFELSINGAKVGDHRLDPMYTRFDRRLLYVTYDITEHLLREQNTLGVVLGNGWYNHQSTAVWFFDKAPWRNRPTFCMDVRITYEDGTVETITTDRSWKTNSGPIIFNSIYTAEHYDARLTNTGWDTKDFDDSAWKEVHIRAAPSNNIVAQQLYPIRNTSKLTAKQVKRINDTTYLYDFGRNISGVTELVIKGKKGTVVRLEHGERLDKEGRLDMSNIDHHYRPTDDTDPFQTDIVILSGAEDQFMPKFNYKGFQYVEVTTSQPLKLGMENLTAYFMHSDVPSIGKIHSSNPTLNKIWEATNNAYLSNLFGYPTDCPQREKNGWTGDGHIAVETGLYNFDGITIYEKWINDHLDEQQPNGVLPAIIPTSGWGYHWANGPDWTSTIAIIPWNIYLFYGDTTLLSRAYDAMKKYVDYIDYKYPSGLTDWGLGDWVPVRTKSNVELTTSIYFYVDADILAKAAKIFGRTEDVDRYSSLAVKIKNAINAKYLDYEKGIYSSGTQTELSMPLYWKIVPEHLVEKVTLNLVEKVKTNNYFLDVGLLGTKSILNALSENGYADIAYQIASKEEYPSWGWWIKNGATTLYENWDIGAKKDISMNHIMFGEIGAWYYKGLAGIKPMETAPGFDEVNIKPFIPENLKEFSASFHSVRGEIKVSWRQEKSDVYLTIQIPSNMRARFAIPMMENRRPYLAGKEIKDKEIVIGQGEYELLLK